MSCETFGQQLKRLREAKIVTVSRSNRSASWARTGPISQNELALRAGVDVASINRIESGEKPSARRSTVLAIAEALALSPLDTDRLLIAAGYVPHCLAQLDEERLCAVLTSLQGVEA